MIKVLWSIQIPDNIIENEDKVVFSNLMVVYLPTYSVLVLLLDLMYNYLPIFCSDLLIISISLVSMWAGKRILMR